MNEVKMFSFEVMGRIPEETKQKMLKEMEEANGGYDSLFYKFFKRVPERLKKSSVTVSILEQLGKGGLKYFESMTFTLLDNGNTNVEIGVSNIFVQMYMMYNVKSLFGSSGEKSSLEDIKRILKKKAIKDYGLKLAGEKKWI